MAMTASSVQLGCGRSIDDVWDNINNPPSRHELNCAYCETARSDLAGLAQATRELRAEEDKDTDLQASPATIDRILSIARSEVRRGRRLPLHQPGPDHVSELTVSEQAVSVVIRRVGDQTAGVQIRRCTVQLVSAEAGQPDIAAAPHTQTMASTILEPEVSRLAVSTASDVRVSLRVSVDATASIPSVVNDLRTAIIDVVDREVGIKVQTIHVAVEDVHNV